MWSKRAEEIVTQLIARQNTEQLDSARTDALRLKALFIGVDFTACYYLRPNGELVIVDDDAEGRPVDTLDTDPKRVLCALVWSSRRFPVFCELFPERPSGAKDCSCMEIPLFAERRVICPDCCGLGWLPP